MEATIRISINELTPDFVKKLKMLLNKDQEIELTINPVGDFGLNNKESKEEYIQRIQEALTNLSNGKFVAFSEQELDEFSENLLS
ncbi:MAG: hypothetical protein IH597_11380 [Bacteroidales bacterium]|nr:hypothetical protein [Bacteroidales bacterium]